jgi:hypothetical protein
LLVFQKHTTHTIILNTSIEKYIMAIQPLRRSRNHSDFSKSSDHGKASTEKENTSRSGWMYRRRRTESLTAKVDGALHLCSSSGHEETSNMEDGSFAESSLAIADWNPFDDDDVWTTAASTITSEQSSSYTTQNATGKVLKSPPLTRSRKTASTKKDPELDLTTRSDSALNRKREPNRATLRRSASSRISSTKKDPELDLSTRSDSVLNRKREPNRATLRRSASSNPIRPRRRKERNALKPASRSFNASTPSAEDSKPNRGALSSFLGKGYISSFLGASQRDDLDNDDDQLDEKSHVSFLSKGMSALEKMYDNVNY